MWPDANVGLATGELIVIDVDGALGDASLQRLQHEHRPLPGHARGDQRPRPAPVLHRPLGAARQLRRPPRRRPRRARERWLHRRARRACMPTAIAIAGAPAVAPPPCRCGSPSCSQRRRPRRRAPSPLPQPTPAIAVAATSSPRYAPSSPRSPPHPRRRPAGPAPATTRSTAPPSGSRQLAVDGAGTLDELERHLLDAALAAGLDELEARATIASGLRAGQQHPRR